MAEPIRSTRSTSLPVTRVLSPYRKVYIPLVRPGIVAARIQALQEKSRQNESLTLPSSTLEPIATLKQVQEANSLDTPENVAGSTVSRRQRLSTHKSHASLAQYVSNESRRKMRGTSNEPERCKSLRLTRVKDSQPDTAVSSEKVKFPKLKTKRSWGETGIGNVATRAVRATEKQSPEGKQCTEEPEDPPKLGSSSGLSTLNNVFRLNTPVSPQPSWQPRNSIAEQLADMIDQELEENGSDKIVGEGATTATYASSEIFRAGSIVSSTLDRRHCTGATETGQKSEEQSKAQDPVTQPSYTAYKPFELRLRKVRKPKTQPVDIPSPNRNPTITIIEDSPTKSHHTSVAMQSPGSRANGAPEHISVHRSGYSESNETHEISPSASLVAERLDNDKGSSLPIANPSTSEHHTPPLTPDICLLTKPAKIRRASQYLRTLSNDSVRTTGQAPKRWKWWKLVRVENDATHNRETIIERDAAGQLYRVSKRHPLTVRGYYGLECGDDDHPESRCPSSIHRVALPPTSPRRTAQDRVHAIRARGKRDTEDLVPPPLVVSDDGSLDLADFGPSLDRQGDGELGLAPFPDEMGFTLDNTDGHGPAAGSGKVGGSRRVTSFGSAESFRSLRVFFTFRKMANSAVNVEVRRKFSRGR